MTARARVLAVTADVHVLVLDRVGLITTEQVQRLVDAAKTNDVFRAVLVFPFELDLPEVDSQYRTEQGVTLHSDEVDAIERLYRVTEGVTGDEFRNVDLNTIRLLLSRAREARS
jgi:hypothetical protein